MIESMFGPEGSLIVRFVVAFLIVLGLIGLTFWLIRRFGGTRVSAAQQRGRQPRLAVVDAAPVDGRRRLVLIRRDNVEHLVMIGGPSDIVVEQNILRAVPVTAPREMPVPRTPGAVEAASATRTLPPDEPAWTPEPPPAPRVPEPAARPAFARPDPLGRLRPAEAPVARPTLGRPLPPPEPPPIAPEPSLDEPRAGATSADAALASMAQRLEAALRRPPATPGEPGKPDAPSSTERPAPVSLDPPDTESPSTAPNGNGGRPEQKPSKAKSTLDSLEAEMASLLGRPPGKE